MPEYLGLFAEMFSYVEIISFIWLYIFSKSYRKIFREKWNNKKVGIERESRAILITDIIFSIIFNALIIGGLLYIVF
jgi:hypothetical protein